MTGLMSQVTTLNWLKTGHSRDRSWSYKSWSKPTLECILNLPFIIWQPDSFGFGRILDGWDGWVLDDTGWAWSHCISTGVCQIDFILGALESLFSVLSHCNVWLTSGILDLTQFALMRFGWQVSMISLYLPLFISDWLYSGCVGKPSWCSFSSQCPIDRWHPGSRAVCFDMVWMTSEHDFVVSPPVFIRLTSF